MKIEIAPSLLACDLGRLNEEIRAVENAGADVLHFDIMDGHFVPNLTFGFPLIEKVRQISKLPFDAHLMMNDADRYLEEFHRVGCNWLSVHVEACPHLNRTVNRIKELGMKAGVAINPGTSLVALNAILSEVDYVLLMSVNPGFAGQKFISGAFDRVRELKKKIGPRPVRIQIDGGIKETNIREAAEAGAEIMVLGTGIFSAKDYSAQIATLRAKAEGKE
jgi:ribulose-phosphate 3-epimerase